MNKVFGWKGIDKFGELVKGTQLAENSKKLISY